MVFSSYTFLFAFLPLCLAVFAALLRTEADRPALVWIVACSLFFYAWWNPAYLPLLLASTMVNFGVGRALALPAAPAARGGLLAAGVLFDLALLGYFKYAGFFIASVNAALAGSWRWTPVVLPLGISFFTFQQIAYLVDVYYRRAEEHDILDYAFFVTFFPQLIAGPIVRFGEIIPQMHAARLRLEAGDFAVGSAMFQLGLAKKVLLADELAPYVSSTFDAVGGGATPSFATAWVASASFLLQVYFDFSGYSDMAIGLARMLGLRLPFNFASPLKAPSPIEFWSRWHITVTRFFRDHVWRPLGGNEGGNARRTALRFLVFLLIGLWHGAAWTFVVFGAVQGVYVIANNALRVARRGSPSSARVAAAGRVLGIALTFTAMTVSAVFFRSPSFACAGSFLASMLALHGLGGSTAGMNAARWALLALALAIVWLMPNTQQLLRSHHPGLGPVTPNEEPAMLRRLEWRPTLPWAAALALLTVACVLQISRALPFIYYQF